MACNYKLDLKVCFSHFIFVSFCYIADSVCGNAYETVRKDGLDVLLSKCPLKLIDALVTV